jgi:hypothetical protein
MSRKLLQTKYFVQCLFVKFDVGMIYGGHAREVFVE